MNNNRGSNRRRGRGNRQQGGGQPMNRIDSRARGNAPQLLEKYRKLAHDAHLNGDRVQAEYYLQFADHYFRVIADGRQRQEEQRQRRDERWEGGSDEHDDAGDFNAEGDFPSFEQPQYARSNRDERPRRQRPPQDERPEREERAAPESESEVADEGDGQANRFEPAENPFVRENRPVAGLRPRRALRQAQGDREERRPRREEREEQGGDEPITLDPASLPPSISTTREEGAEEAEAKPRRGRPRRKPSADDAGGEALESVS